MFPSCGQKSPRPRHWAQHTLQVLRSDIGATARILSATGRSISVGSHRCRKLAAARYMGPGRKRSDALWIGLTKATKTNSGFVLKITTRRRQRGQYAFRISRRVSWHNDYDFARQWRRCECVVAADKGRKFRLDRHHHRLAFCGHGGGVFWLLICPPKDSASTPLSAR